MKPKAYISFEKYGKLARKFIKTSRKYDKKKQKKSPKFRSSDGEFTPKEKGRS